MAASVGLLIIMMKVWDEDVESRKNAEQLRLAFGRRARGVMTAGTIELLLLAIIPWTAEEGFNCWSNRGQYRLLHGKRAVVVVAEKCPLRVWRRRLLGWDGPLAALG